MRHNYCVITIFLEQPLQTPPVPQSSPRTRLAPHLARKSLQGSLGVPQARLQLWLCQMRAVCPQPPVDQGSLLLRHSVHHREFLVAGWCLAKQDKLFQGLRLLLGRAGAGGGSRGTAPISAFLPVTTSCSLSYELWNCQLHSVSSFCSAPPFLIQKIWMGLGLE